MFTINYVNCVLTLLICRSVLSDANFQLSADKRFVIVQIDEDSDRESSSSFDESDHQAAECADNSDWSDDWTTELTDTSEPKSWNNPENWTLPLEVTNPELWQNKHNQLGSGYLQGFHKGATIKKSMSVQFVEAYNRCDRRTVIGQFEDSYELLKDNPNTRLTGDQTCCCETSQEYDLSAKNELKVDNVINGIRRVKLDDEGTVDDKHSNDAKDLCYIPGLERCGVNMLSSWKKHVVDIVPEQFDMPD